MQTPRSMRLARRRAPWIPKRIHRQVLAVQITAGIMAKSSLNCDISQQKVKASCDKREAFLVPSNKKSISLISPLLQKFAIFNPDPKLRSMAQPTDYYEVFQLQRYGNIL